ncbi:hypothetical protein Goshw_001443 [Gossypium schwendimanii]|uniref:Glycosyltransferase n=1 Tax=Gossypium schwendimanii TaxID=34291 RepID=A0A7J9LTC2_GOSSC|nr:hypothetical protein [Gossypium schwendimanii]
MEEAIVIYPAPMLTHLAPMVEFAKLLLTHHPSLSIHILIATLPSQPSSTVPSPVPPSITFHYLPTVDLLSTSTDLDPLFFDVIRLRNPDVRRTLLTISNNYTLNAIIVDFFCTSAAFEVASDLNLPAYSFLPSALGAVACLLYLPTLCNKFTQSFQHLNVLLDIPGAPPIPSADMPPTTSKGNKLYDVFLDIATNLRRSTGIIVDTFEYLEPKSFKEINDGLCLPDYPTPPLYCIGPLIVNTTVDGDGVPECIKWLHSQPSKSVVFLCFGSLGSFSVQQLKEIAVGLERSGQRFLWIVRNPPLENQSLNIDSKIDPDLKSLLPPGFLERTKEKGLVVKSWAPQLAVLNHDSVGGFVTHCGWNSVLESVCAGVPMLAWPLYAEQRLNRVLIVEEMKIALPMVESETGFVSSTEVEKRVKELMGSKEGDSVRERTLAMKHAAKVATSEGGSTRIALAKLVESWNRQTTT